MQGSEHTASHADRIDMFDENEHSRDTVSTDELNLRKMAMIEAYESGNKSAFNKNTMSSFNRAIRKLAIPHIKFLETSKGFGSFEKPDFSDEECWVNKIFEFVNMANTTDKRKVSVWMTYRNKVKEQFSLHRSSVTSKVKEKFVKGEKSYFITMC